MDIDIDVAPATEIDKILPCVRASMVRNEELARHPVGVYLQEIPRDPKTSLAAIPYEAAAGMGFFKFDFLNLHALHHYTTKAQIQSAIDADPNWDLLRDPEVVAQLFHLGKHFDVIDAVRPTSVDHLADCLALIRPGKRALLDKYIRRPESVRSQLYVKTPDEQYSFKRSHAIAYALVIVLQLHALNGGHSLAVDDMLEW